MMYIQITHPTEFFKVVEPAYDALIQVGDETATLDIALAPGQYDGEHFKIIDRQNAGCIGIRVRAADPQQPPILTNLTVNLAGRALYLDHLVIADSAFGDTLITLRARDEIIISNCAFVELKRSTWPPGGALATIEPAFGGTTARLFMRDCCWLGNCQGSTAYLLDLSGQQTSWASVHFERVVFLDNSFDLGIRLGAVHAATFETCLLHTATEIIRIEYVGTQLQVCNSLLVGEQVINNLVKPDIVVPMTAEALLDPAKNVPSRLNLADNQQFCEASLVRLNLSILIGRAREGIIPDIQTLADQLSG